MKAVEEKMRVGWLGRWVGGVEEGGGRVDV